MLHFLSEKEISGESVNQRRRLLKILMKIEAVLCRSPRGKLRALHII